MKSGSILATKSRLTVSAASEMMGVSQSSVRTLVDEGQLESYLTSGRHRRISLQSIRHYMGLDDVGNDSDRLTVLYSRCSTASQKEALISQEMELKSWQEKNGGEDDEVLSLSEIGGGLNLERKKFTQLLELVFAGKVRRIVLTYGERLTRVGVKVFFNLFERFGTEIIVINDTVEKTLEAELLADLTDSVFVFSIRRYAERSAEKMRYKISDEIKERAIALHGSGLTLKQVWKRLKRLKGFKDERSGVVPSYSWVCNLCMKHSEKVRAERGENKKRWEQTQLCKFWNRYLVKSEGSDVRTQLVKERYLSWLAQEKLEPDVEAKGYFWSRILLQYGFERKSLRGHSRILDWEWREDIDFGDFGEFVDKQLNFNKKQPKTPGKRLLFHAIALTPLPSQ